MEGKNAVFQKLKPPCVALSQAAIALSGPQANRQTITDRLETLKSTLSAVILPPSTLDPKLAEYAFFPISQVLKASQKVSVRGLELCLQCVAILIEQGWQQQIPAQLAAQVVILCTLLAEQKPKGLTFEETTDELRSSALWCLYHIFSVVIAGSEAQSVLVNESNFPQLGQTISVILDGIQVNGSVEVQISAGHALEGLIANVLDREIQASFLPGIVSKLTHILTPQTKLRRNHRVMIKCLDILGTLLRNTLGDLNTSVCQGNGEASTSQASTKSIIDARWNEQAAMQLKPALTEIMKLRNHSRTDVQIALSRLCAILLQSCRKTLTNCSHMALETMVTMSGARPDSGSLTDLEMLVATDSGMTELLQTLLYDWVQSLTTAMQGSDEEAKFMKIRQASMAYELLGRGGVYTHSLTQLLANTLRDCVVVTLTLSGEKPSAPVASEIQSLDLDVLDHKRGNMYYTSPLLERRGQEETLQALDQFAHLISSSTANSIFASSLARSLRHSQGEIQIANLWLLLTATHKALLSKEDVDQFLDIESESNSIYQECLQELYSFSMSVLSDSSAQDTDPRLQALVLRVLALQAQVAGRDFRYELVDALYPVLHMLATPDQNLQRDSITTLNIFAGACGYVDVKELIVDNVDYLTNAVALRLNTFDVSPQAPQVLLMMVRLAGPTLLPYLEDTVESIFAALEDYHGYPLLVELLFKVLGVIAEEGSKAPKLAITSNEAESRRWLFNETWRPVSIESLAIALKDRAEEERRRWDDESDDTRASHPTRPWKGVEEEDGEDKIGDEDLEADPNQQIDDAEPPPPAPKTYNLLFKITELTQHFLPSASPSLRTSLLSLIRTTVPAIARHENSFLPLINTLWPEVISRLDDSEPYVIATALEIVQVLCEYAGDFMRTRIVQLWPRLIEIYHTSAKAIVQANLLPSTSSLNSSQQGSSLVLSETRIRQAVSRMQAAPANYGDTSTRIVWATLVSCITAAVRFVHVSPEMFDEALEMVYPVLERQDVASAFIEENSDAVWLARMRYSTTGSGEKPPVVANARWRFAGAVG